jgi:hypothetical protein
MAHRAQLIEQLVSLTKSQDIQPQSLPVFFMHLFKCHSLTFVDLSSGLFPPNLFEQECVVVYVDPVSVLITVKLKSAVSFGQVSGLMLSSLDFNELNTKLLPFKRALAAERKLLASRESFRKTAEIEVIYKRIELQGEYSDGIRLMSALTTVAKLPRMVRINLTALKHRLLKPVTPEDYAAMLDEFIDFVSESSGLTRANVYEELNKSQGGKPVKSSSSFAPNSNSALAISLPCASSKSFAYSETKGGSFIAIDTKAVSEVSTERMKAVLSREDDFMETSRVGTQLHGYLQTITREEIDESQSFTGRLSQNQDQAYLSREDTEEDPVSPKPIEFTRETPKECTTPVESDDSYVEVVYNPFRRNPKLETVNEQAEEDKRLESYIFYEEDVNEEAVRKPVLTTHAKYEDELQCAKSTPVLSFKMSEGLEPEEIQVVRVMEHDELMECCTCDARCSRVCLLI